MAEVFTLYNGILVGLGVILIICFIAIRNLLLKVEQYQEITEDHVQYLQNISNTIRYIDQRIEEVDSKGTFQSDDEVGFFFLAIKEIKEELNRYMLPENYGKEEI